MQEGARFCSACGLDHFESQAQNTENAINTENVYANPYEEDYNKAEAQAQPVYPASAQYPQSTDAPQGENFQSAWDLQQSGEITITRKNKKKGLVVAVIMIVLVVVGVIAFQKISTMIIDHETSKNSIKTQVELHGEELAQEIKEGLEPSMGECQVSVKEENKGIVVDVKIMAFTDVSQSEREMMEYRVKMMQSSVDSAAQNMRKELKELAFYKINIRDAYGNLLASVTGR